MYDEEENWTDYARELDKMSLKAYLDQFRGKAPDWAVDLFDVAAEPLDGRVQFAGEHTSSEFLGYMNGGVQSGNRASEALIEVLALKKLTLGSMWRAVTGR